MMSDSELERLALGVEEAAEVQQIAMKIMRHGYESHNPFDESMTSNRSLLEKELGDLLFAVEFMIQHDDLNRSYIKRYRNKKKKKIQGIFTL